MNRLLILALLTALALACGSAARQQPTRQQPTRLPSLTPTPVEGEAATEAPALPIATLPAPVPTNTTALPTNTPAPGPTATPIIMDGSGDSVVDIPTTDPVLLRITGNADSQNFAVIAHGPRGQDLLVNVLDPYSGIRPLNLQDISNRLEIKAVGNWHIELWPLVSARHVAAPGEIQGQGDDVVMIDGPPTKATISGNQSGSNFAVLAYGSTGIDLLVNTLDPYQGTVLLDPETVILEINAVGEWRIEID